MVRPRFREHSLRTRLLAALMLVVGVGAAWIGWRRFRVAGASSDSGAVQEFLERRFATLSGGVYHVALGHIHFDIAGSGARIDSVVITTDTLRNQALAHPLPRLFVVLREAEVRGVVRTAGGERITIDEIRFGGVDALLIFARADTARPAIDTTVHDLVSWTLQLPAGAPQVVIGRLLLPGMTVEVRPAPGTGGRPQRIEHLSLVLDSVRLDRRAEGLDVPVVVRDIRVRATAFEGGWDSASTVSIGTMEGSFRDSTLRLTALGLAPRRSLRSALRRGGARRERYTVTIDSIGAEGVDWGAALRVGAVPARSVVLDGLDLQILTDKRIPGRPTPRPRQPILQETLVRFGRPVAIDSLRLRGGRVRYQVRPESGDGVGVVDFQRVEARLTGFVWSPDAMLGKRAAFTFRASLWGAAPLVLAIGGPLDARAPAVDMDLFVGAMPMMSANAFASTIGRMDIKGGTLDSVRARVHLVGDRCDGEARPYYHDLSIRLISRGGFLSRLAGGARTVIANSFVVRDDNPGADGVVMAGAIAEARDPWQAFWPFLWACTKGGLARVAAGQGVADLPQ